MPRVVPATAPVPITGRDPLSLPRSSGLLSSIVAQAMAPGLGAKPGAALPSAPAGGGFTPQIAETIPMPASPAIPVPGGVAPAAKPAFFGKGGLGWDILGTLADASAVANRQNPTYWATKALRDHERTQEQLRQATRQEDRRWQVEDRDAKLNAPQYFNAGRDRVRLDPATGQAAVVYDAPEDYETYADTLGLHPGDEGYDGAVQDYVLRGNGPTSQAARQALDRARQVDRLALEGQRQSNRQTLRSSPTYANLHPATRRSGAARPPKSTSAVVAPILLKMARGEPLTSGEQQALAFGRGGGRGGSGRGTSLPVLSSPADVAKLPSGTRFKTPDGRTKVAP